MAIGGAPHTSEDDLDAVTAVLVRALRAGLRSSDRAPQGDEGRLGLFSSEYKVKHDQFLLNLRRKPLSPTPPIDQELTDEFTGRIRITPSVGQGIGDSGDRVRKMCGSRLRFQVEDPVHGPSQDRMVSRLWRTSLVGPALRAKLPRDLETGWRFV